MVWQRIQLNGTETWQRVRDRARPLPSDRPWAERVLRWLTLVLMLGLLSILLVLGLTVGLVVLLVVGLVLLLRRAYVGLLSGFRSSAASADAVRRNVRVVERP